LALRRMRTGLMLQGGICSFDVLIGAGGRNVSGFWSVDAYSFVYSCPSQHIKHCIHAIAPILKSRVNLNILCNCNTQVMIAIPMTKVSS
jgi:hypothetical protein